MVATPGFSVPTKAKAGESLKLYGAGFRPGTKVRIVFDAARHVVVGSARARSDGTFKASIVVPARAGAGAHKLQVVGTGPSGHSMSLAAPVIILADPATAVLTATPGRSLAEPVMLTLAVVMPLATWLALEMLGWRGRRADNRTTRG